jgi:hypothetical protein
MSRKKKDTDSDSDSDSNSDSEHDENSLSKTKVALGVGIGIAVLIGAEELIDHVTEPPGGGAVVDSSGKPTEEYLASDDCIEEHGRFWCDHGGSDGPDSWSDMSEHGPGHEAEEIGGNEGILDDDQMTDIGQSETMKSLLFFYQRSIDVSPNAEMYYGTDGQDFQDSILGTWKGLVDDWPTNWDDIEHWAICYQVGDIFGALFGPDTDHGPGTGRDQYPLYDIFSNHMSNKVVIVLKLGAHVYEYYPDDGLYEQDPDHSPTDASFDVGDLRDWVDGMLDSHQE